MVKTFVCPDQREYFLCYIRHYLWGTSIFILLLLEKWPNAFIDHLTICNFGTYWDFLVFTLGAECVCLASQLVLVFEGDVYFSLVQSVLKCWWRGNISAQSWSRWLLFSSDSKCENLCFQFSSQRVSGWGLWETLHLFWRRVASFPVQPLNLHFYWLKSLCNTELVIVLSYSLSWTRVVLGIPLQSMNLYFYRLKSVCNISDVPFVGQRHFALAQLESGKK